MNQSVLDVPAVQAVATGGSGIPWTTIFIMTVILYPLVCTVLRFRRVNGMEKRFGYGTRKKMSEMTNEDAQAILRIMSELEFPRIYKTSLQFALFKVCRSCFHFGMPI
jgi:hypothetical protein